MKFLYALLIIISAGCADKITSLDDLNKNNTPQSGNPARLARLSEIQKQIFNSKCAIGGCHDNASKAEGLDLSSGRSYNNLVLVQSRLYPSFKLVMPGDPSKSLLTRLLTGETQPQMPVGGNLAPAEIDSIKAWISNGAKND